MRFSAGLSVFPAVRLQQRENMVSMVKSGETDGEVAGGIRGGFGGRILIRASQIYV